MDGIPRLTVEGDSVGFLMSIDLPSRWLLIRDTILRQNISQAVGATEITENSHSQIVVLHRIE